MKTKPGILLNKFKNGMLGRLYEKFLIFIGGQKYLSIQLDITNACNLRCKHCYHSDHRNNDALGLAEWKEIINQYENLCSKLRLKPFIVICGGEPLTSCLLLPLIKFLDEKWHKVKIAVLTNGTLVTDQLINDLSAFNVCFQVSLDGPNSKDHDFVRGKGSFSKAVSGIEKLTDKGFEVSVLTVLSQRTLPLISQFFELAKGLPIESINFTRLIAEGNGKCYVETGEDSPLPPLKLKDAYTQIVHNSRVSKIKTNTNSPLYHLIDANLGGNGKFGFQGLVVDYQGNLKVSSRANFVLGNVLKDGIDGLFFDSSIMNDLRNGLIEKCGPCRHYKRCGGDSNAAFAAYKSFLAPDPGCWIGD